MEEPKPFTRRKKEPEAPPAEWWDRYGPHPLSDVDFVKAFCEHILLTTNDRELRILRDRAFRFIRNVLHQQMEKELSRYREVSA